MLTFWAMSISAGIIGDLFVIAGGTGTSLGMCAHVAGTTMIDERDNFKMVGYYFILYHKIPPVLTKDIFKLKFMGFLRFRGHFISLFLLLLSSFI